MIHTQGIRPKLCLYGGPVLKQRSQRGLFFGFASRTLVLAALFAAAAVAVSHLFPDKGVEQTSAEPAHAFRTVVIDPGHGGADGGAAAPDGTLEKDLNLDMGMRLYRMLSAAGYDCKMTRYGDEMLTDGTDAPKKLSDLRARVRAADGGILVSVHQNKFPQASCSGTQVYYSKNDPGSQKLAAAVQSLVSEHLQKDNKRQIKRAGSEIYVLDNSIGPAILIECGFLSNPAELEKLCDEDYRKRLSAVIFCAITRTMAENGEAYEK